MVHQVSVRSMFASMSCCALVACGGATAGSDPAQSPAAADHPLVGQRGPDFAKKTVTGDATVSIHSMSGKVAIVDFWATWCGPCRKSFPKLQQLSAKYAADGLRVVGVSEDDNKDGICDFTSDLGTSFPIVWDENKSIASKWEPKSMPCTFILDRNGTIRFVHLGYHDNEDAVMEREIQSLL
jgi:DsbE subfamily thiol:disulfide oxidoreductase